MVVKIIQTGDWWEGRGYGRWSRQGEEDPDYVRWGVCVRVFRAGTQTL